MKRTISSLAIALIAIATLVKGSCRDDLPTDIYDTCERVWDSGQTTNLVPEIEVNCDVDCTVCDGNGLLTGLYPVQETPLFDVTGLIAVCSKYDDHGQISNQFEAIPIYNPSSAAASPIIPGSRDVYPIAVHLLSESGMSVDSFAIAHANRASDGDMRRGTFVRTNWFATDRDLPVGTVLGCPSRGDVVHGIKLRYDTDFDLIRSFEVMTRSP